MMDSYNHTSLLRIRKPLRQTHGWRGFPFLFVILGLTLSGCNKIPTTQASHRNVSESISASSDETLSKGVIHRAIQTGASSGMDIVDLDLANANAHIEIGSEDIQLYHGKIVGNAHLPSEWLENSNALCVINGGYFGIEQGSFKEIIGLFTENGKVRHAAPPMSGHGGNGLSAGKYVRSVFAVSRDGTPVIAWAATVAGKPQEVRSYPYALLSSQKPGRRWKPINAVGCGPTLIANGKTVDSDRKERLSSKGDLPRTFVAYDKVHGKPDHFILGIISASTYEDLTAHITEYYRRYHHTSPWAAMCMDGGASTQMSYKINGHVESPRDTGVTVPTCVMIMPGK